MQELESNNKQENFPEENPLPEEILIKADNLAKRLISLIQTDKETEIDPRIIIPGELPDEQRMQKAIWDSGCFNGLGLSITRHGTETNDMTEISIHFYPNDHEKLDLFSQIEKGLAKEWIKKNQQALLSKKHKVITYLQNIGPKGLDLATIKLVYNRLNKPGDYNPIPIAIQISINMPDNSNITFDPLITYRDLKEERGVFSRIVHKRILDKLKQSIEQEESFLFCSIMKDKLKKIGLFNFDEGDDEHWGQSDPPVNGTKHFN